MVVGFHTDTILARTLFLSSSRSAVLFRYIPLEGIIFVVYFGDNMPLFVEKILFENSKWFNELLQRLIIFIEGLFSLR